MNGAGWRLKCAGWRWMELGGAGVEVDGAGCSWVHGLVISKFQYVKTKSLQGIFFHSAKIVF